MKNRNNNFKTGFVPVTLGELALAQLSLSIHCRDCGHFSKCDAAAIRLPPARTIASLDGAFFCSWCGSRNSCAMPFYPRPVPGD